MTNENNHKQTEERSAFGYFLQKMPWHAKLENVGTFFRRNTKYVYIPMI